MKRTHLSPLVFAATTLCAHTARAQISAHVSGKVNVASEYLDRGVILTNQPMIEPGLTIALPVGGGTATIGIWAAVQPSTYTSTQYFSMAPGEKSPNLTETRPSLELAQQMGVARVAFKATMRLFPNTVGLTKDANTADVASIVTLTRFPFSPAVMVAYDFGAINGAYVEGRATQSSLLTKGVTINLGGQAGYSVHQRVDSAPAVFAPYERNGFTHLDLTAGVAVTVAGATIEPYLTYTFVPDPLDSPLAPGRQDRETLVFGTSISVAGTFPKAKAKR